MAGSRKSTPSRARSSSVTSNASVASTTNASKTVKSPKSPKAPRASTKAAAAKETGSAPATPRKSKGGAAGPKTGGDTPAKKLSAAQQAALASRRPLPVHRNPALPLEDIPVKLQIIQREGENIIIGRVKLPVPGKPDHGFLLKRFDTNAIAASSMFRLAFPSADEKAEEAEMKYLEQRYDVDVANGGVEKVASKRGRGRPSKKALEAGDFIERLPAGSTGVRLQGTWIPCADGLDIAKEYGLERFARPLIESKATQSDHGVPILTPAANDKVSTPTSGRSKKMLKQALDEAVESGSPSAARKRAKEENAQDVSVEKSTLQAGLSSDQMSQQIQESQALAKSIQANAGSSLSTPSRKRRAANQSPSSRINHLDEGEDYESANVVVRSFRRGTRAARRRPIATTAGALGAVGAVGAGTLAWLAGGNFDVAAQLVQQGVSNLGSYFF